MSVMEPHGVSLKVPFQAPSASLVRRELKDWLQHRGFTGETLEDARVVISELVGNSVRHAHPLPVNHLTVSWFMDDDDLVLSVSDGGSGTTPQQLDVSEGAVSGRGLWIVQALVEGWWVENQRGHTTVNARVPLGNGQEVAS